MTALIACLMVGLDQSKVRALSQARAEFEALVPASADRYAHTFSMFHVNRSSAVYPAGVGSRRYMIGTYSPESGILIAESRLKETVTIDWSLPLVAAPREHSPKGTLAKMLAGYGLRVGNVHVSKAQQASLQAIKPFVWYFSHPIMGWSLTFIDSSGKATSEDRFEQGTDFSKFWPICDDEAEFAGLDDKGWDAGGKHIPGN